MNYRKKILFIAAILYPFALYAKPKITLPAHSAAKSVAPAPKNIDSTYFLQISLDDEGCKKAFDQSCYFRDSLFEELYFHGATLDVAFNKIFATQDFNNKTTSLKVRDGSYLLHTNNENLVSFAVKNGVVDNLQLLEGNLAKESQITSKCSKAKHLYNFYTIYNKMEEISKESGNFKDNHDFQGLSEYIIFAENNNPSELMAVQKTADGTISAISNIELCKMPRAQILTLRHNSAEECTLNPENQECAKYQNCENKVAVESCELMLFEGFDEPASPAINLEITN